MRRMHSKASAIGFILMVAAFTVPRVAFAQPTVTNISLIGFTNTVWKYRPNTNDPMYSPADAWTATTFDDSSWFSGRGLFGYESTPNEYDAFGPFNTYIVPPNGVAAGLPIFPGQATSPLSAGPSGAGTGGPSAYFRTHFTWTGPLANVTLNFTNTGDDGWIVYLNGVEIFSFDMLDMPRPMTWDINMLPGGANPRGEAAAIVTNIVPSNLVVGDNVLAIELHQQGTGSSDDIMGVAVRGILPLAPIVTDTTQPSNRTVLQLRSTTLSAVAIGAPALSYQWFKGTDFIQDATNSTFTITNMQSTDAGNYYCHISNVLGSTDTRMAVLLYTEDTTPPTLVRATGSATFDIVTVEFSEGVDLLTSTDPINYDVSEMGGGPLGVMTVDRNGDEASVTLHLTTMMQEGLTYVVTVNFVKDLTGLDQNTIAPDSQIQFHSWVTGCGGMLFEVFRPLSTTDNSINTTLLADPDYPNNPQERYRITGFDTRLAYPDDSHEGYGGRLRGLFIPPLSGSWIFYLLSDDSSRLWLNSSGPSPAGKVLIQEQTGCCGTFSDHPTAPIPLIAGQAYYIEAIYKEGTGGDYCQVAGKLANDPTPPNSLTPLSGAYFGSPAAPANLISPFTITQQPANAQGSPGIATTFSVATSTDVPLCYQWLRGGVEIDGAVGPNYTLVPTLPDDGAVFSVRISAAGGAQVVSANATLRVIPDTIHPTVVSATADATGTNVVVTFSENMDMATAETAGNYTIDTVAVSSARKTSTTNVALVTAARLDSCASHQLRVSGVKDLSLNSVNPDPTTISFRLPGIILLSVGDGHSWRFDESGVDRGTAWKEVGYDDSGWAQGTTLFGVKNVTPPTNNFSGIPVATQLSLTNANYPTNAVTDNPTYYFRTHFTLPTDPLAVTALRLRPVVDDGVVLYLNGQEIYRLRVTPAEDAFASYLSAASVGDANYEGPVGLSTAFLVSGDNVLAAELKQQAPTSSDAAFGLELVAEIPICGPGLHIARSGPNIVLTWSDATYHLDSAPAPSGTWTRNASATSGFSTPASGAPKFFRLSKP